MWRVLPHPLQLPKHQPQQRHEERLAAAHAASGAAGGGPGEAGLQDGVDGDAGLTCGKGEAAAEAHQPLGEGAEAEIEDGAEEERHHDQDEQGAEVAVVGEDEVKPRGGGLDRLVQRGGEIDKEG